MTLPAVTARGWRRAAVVGALVFATIGGGGLPAPAWLAGPVTPAASAADAPSSASIVISKGAATKGYDTTRVTLAQGGSLSVVNFDSMQHTVTSTGYGADGKPLFNTYVSPGSTVSVPGASKLAPGSYDFRCLFHSVMRGTLVIEGSSGGGVKPTAPSFDQPLVVPKVLTDAHLRIPMKAADVRVLPTGPLTRMWTFGGSYPGPLIERPVGHDTTVTFVNKLPRHGRCGHRPPPR